MKILLILSLILSNFAFAKKTAINILYLEELIKRPPVLSNITEKPEDSGLSGARMAIKDSIGTTRFSNQKYFLKEARSYDSKEIIEHFKKWIKKKNVFVVANISTKTLVKIFETKEFKKSIMFNTGNFDNSLRINQCKKNLLHTSPSYSMLSDALVQYLMVRNWKNWQLIKGNKPEDKAIAQAFKESAKKFGGKIISEKEWSFNTDLRRLAQKEMPVFTQTRKDYDVVLVADWFGDFGEYVYFNTWLPRPVAGTQGLKPVTWHKVIEQWGAAQLQSRFEKLTGRWMNDLDYTNWVSIATIVKSVMKTKTIEKNKNLDYIYSDKFKLGAYKGRTMTYRSFNGQLRQPIALVHPKGLVSSSPQDQYLHPTTNLDTIGTSSAKVRCE